MTLLELCTGMAHSLLTEGEQTKDVLARISLSLVRSTFFPPILPFMISCKGMPQHGTLFSSLEIKVIFLSFFTMDQTNLLGRFSRTNRV